MDIFSLLTLVPFGGRDLLVEDLFSSVFAGGMIDKRE